jgi:hypothetical protein
MAWGPDVKIRGDAALDFGAPDGLGLYDPEEFRGKIPAEYLADPRFTVAWLYTQLNSEDVEHPNPDDPTIWKARPRTALFGIRLLEVAQFAHLNRHSVLFDDGGTPVDVWTAFFDAGMPGGDTLCRWMAMLLILQNTPSGGGAPAELVKGQIELAKNLGTITATAGDLAKAWETGNGIRKAGAALKACQPKPQ